MPSTEVKPDDAGGSDSSAISQMKGDLLSLKNWETITLTNNLPYAKVIEFGGYPSSGPNTVGGYSKQAPAGVVRVNSLRFQSLIREEAAKKMRTRSHHSLSIGWSETKTATTGICMSTCGTRIRHTPHLRIRAICSRPT